MSIVSLAIVDMICNTAYHRVALYDKDLHRENWDLPLTLNPLPWRFEKCFRASPFAKRIPLVCNMMALPSVGLILLIDRKYNIISIYINKNMWSVMSTPPFSIGHSPTPKRHLQPRGLDPATLSNRQRLYGQYQLNIKWSHLSVFQDFGLVCPHQDGITINV